LKKAKKKKGNKGKRDNTRHGNNTTEARENRIEKSPSWMSEVARAKGREGEERVQDGDATETEEYVW
jgi:hypothetical protein